MPSSDTTTARRRRRRPAAVPTRGAGASALELVSKALEEMPQRRRRRRRRGPRGARGDQRRVARQAGRGSAGHQAGERHPDVGHPEGRERHSHRAVREGAARPLPRRRHPLQHHVAADEVPRCDHVAHQDHVEARHRREAAAAGRPHQDSLPGRRRRRRRSTSASRVCRRSSAKRSSCVCSTRTS